LADSENRQEPDDRRADDITIRSRWLRRPVDVQGEPR
jgi:hypothetical protein